MRFVRKIVLLFIPAGLRHRIKRWLQQRALKANYQYDLGRFLAYGAPFRTFTHGGDLLAYIRMLSHALEKGMSLPNARGGFGVEKARDLVARIREYYQRFGWTSELRGAVACLSQYVDFQLRCGLPLSGFAQEVENLKDFAAQNGGSGGAVGGVVRITREKIWADSRRDLAGFFASRHSIRQFADQPVEIELIRRAVMMAQKTPSVCNRQSARVYVFDNDGLGAAVLSCQYGNRGFGHLARKILVVTSDLNCFLSIGERNQCWIDGGMFAMSLIYALHSLGLGTCCLNWSVECDVDQRLRSTAGIDPSENIIMLIAVGHLTAELTVPCSERKELSEVLRLRCAGSVPENIHRPPEMLEESLPCGSLRSNV